MDISRGEHRDLARYATNARRLNIVDGPGTPKSLARLENTVDPMSGKIDGIHDTLIGNMDVMIEEIHSRVMSWTTPGSSPALTSLSRRDTLVSLTDTLVERPTRRPSSETDCEKWTTNSSPCIPSSSATPEMGSKGLFLQSVRESRSNSSCSSYPKRPESYPISLLDFPKHLPSPCEDARGPSDATRERTPGPNHSCPETCELTPIALPQPSIPVEQSSAQMGPSLSPANITPQQLQAEDRINRALINLDCVSGVTSNIADATVSQHCDFEQMVFKNASILCQVTGLSVEFTKPEDDNKKRSELIQAASESKVSIVTRMRPNSIGRIRYVTSIWTLSHDRKVRMQQQRKPSLNLSHLPSDLFIVFDDIEVIPYTVWGNTTSVVICVPTELKFHDVDIKDKPLSLSKTSWVSYHFKDEDSSRIFQSALMWKRLSHSYRTHRTLRVHDGIFSSFAFQEQLCGLENLRLWKDEEGRFTTAMVHYTPSFREGYLVFRLCGPGTTVSVRDDGEKWIKIKGLSVSTEPEVRGNRSSEDSSGFDPPSSPRKPITSIKIEFSTLREKYKFLEDYKHMKMTR
ncbi:MAG: hypothetical protein Q9214_005805 [Letrouitia sp. 1 TL-2023]